MKKKKEYNSSKLLEFFYCPQVCSPQVNRVVSLAWGFLFILLICVPIARAGESPKWKITAYCACVHCCGKSDAITASGKKAKYGYVACNWLPFGTKVRIEGLGDFVVMDKGAKSLFGDKKNHIKHLDVYMPSHKEALRFGVKFLKVEIL